MYNTLPRDQNLRSRQKEGCKFSFLPSLPPLLCPDPEALKLLLGVLPVLEPPHRGPSGPGADKSGLDRSSQLRLRRLQRREQQIPDIARRFVEVEAHALAAKALAHDVELDATTPIALAIAFRKIITIGEESHSARA